MSWKQRRVGQEVADRRVAVAGEVVARDAAGEQQLIDQRVHAKRRHRAAAASATAGR